MSDVDELLQQQAGTISRAQLAELEIQRCVRDTMLRRRDLVSVLPGVYVDHTGPPSREQRVMAAVLYSGRSAIHLDTALDHPRSSGLIHVAIDVARRVRAPRGVRIHRVVGLEDMVRWNLTPPRVRPELAAIEIAHRAVSDLDAIGALTGVISARRTTASRLATTIANRPRIRRRELLTELIADLEAGTHSVLEHGFLTKVVRPHSIPEPTDRQAPRVGRRGREYRDVVYGQFDIVVELDSRWHDTAEAAERDADRDLDDLASGQVTSRLRYGQIFGTPCRTAARLDVVLARRGWTGAATPCSPGCEVTGRAPGSFDGPETSESPR